MTSETIFPQFPKTRIELPPEFKEIYSAHYEENRKGNSKAAGLAQKLESWMHRKVAADVASGPERSTLEIGAGTLNQLQYETNSNPYDIIEPFHSLFENSPDLARIRKVHDDISDVPAGTSYDRIISIAAFEHICNLPEVIARSGLLLNDGGQLRCGIPSEGTIMWKLGYTISTGREFKRRYGLDYEVLMKYEHVNTAEEIEEVLRYFFKNIERRVFGISRGISFYQFYACVDPDEQRCRSYLSVK